MDRAEAVMDRTETKVQKSKGHFKIIQSRARAWDEINKEMAGAEILPKKKAAKDTSGDAAVAAFYADDDEEMDEVVQDDVVVPVESKSISVPAKDGDEEVL